MVDFLVNWIASVPSFAIPFALAALGLIITEKSGVLSLGAEGFLLIGAMSAIGAFIGLGGSPYLALAVAMLASAMLAMLFGLLVVTLRVNQVVAGLSMVFLAQGITGLVATKQGWSNQPVTGLQTIDWGFLSDIPLLGPILFQQDIICYLAVPIFLATTYCLSNTITGLRLRAVGDGPESADAAGVSVTLYRYGAIAVGSALIGLAGGYLSVGVANIWVEGMAGGRGWIAIALVIFARWSPWRALAGAVLFGGIEALIPRVAAAGLQMPQYFVQMTPYLATLGVMIWASMKRDETAIFAMPRALGLAHTREERR